MRELVVFLIGGLLPTSTLAVRDIVVGLNSPQGIALDPVGGRLYWTEVGSWSMRSALLNGQDVKDVVVVASKEEAPYRVAVDPTGKKVYWTSRCCSLRRANFDGSNIESVVSTTFAGGIALDAERAQIYWTDWVHGEILRVNPEGTVSQELVSGLGSPVDVALDLRNEKVYWADIQYGRVQRASMDGSMVEALNLSWATLQTTGIALDTVHNKIYLTDFEQQNNQYMGRIHRAWMDGSHSEMLVSELGIQKPVDIAIDFDTMQVYWTDEVSGKIQSLKLYCPDGILKVSSRTNTSVALVHHDLIPHGAGATSQCPAGYNGTLRLACDDGVLSVSSGNCCKQCPQGVSVQVTSGGFPGARRLQASPDDGSDDVSSQSLGVAKPNLPLVVRLQHGMMLDGETQEVPCPDGLVGTAQLHCQDGTAFLVVDRCRAPKPCTPGPTLVGQALVEHGEMLHGGQSNGQCPTSFEGTYVLACLDGVVATQSGTCRATCDAGSFWVDRGNVQLWHPTMLSSYTARVVCPSGSAGEGVYIQCDGGYLKVTGGTCTSTQCREGYVQIFGLQVPHPAMDRGSNQIVNCPEGYTGTANLTCVGGDLRVAQNNCFRSCQGGWFYDVATVPIKHEMATHGSIVLAECPSGYLGSVPLQCSDGNLTLACAPSHCACQPIEDTQTVPILIWALALVAGLVVIIIGIALGRRFCRRKCARAASKDPIPLPAPAVASYSVGSEGVFPVKSTGSGRGGPYSPEGFTSVVAESSLSLPLYWATREGVHIFPDPNRINEVQQLMSETWRVCYTRDRRLIAGGDRVPVGCRVANVLRIENHSAFDRYRFYKDRVTARRSGGCPPFRTHTSGRINILDDEVNERYLFHGTHPEAAHAIARDFFRIEKAGTRAGSMFGRGIYLAENASKSDEYATEGGGVYLGLCAMLLCRTVMGNVLTVALSTDCSEHIKSGEYDCVCGDRLAAAGTFREMVFFNEEALYPEFIVIYARIYGDD